MGTPLIRPEKRRELADQMSHWKDSMVHDLAALCAIPSIRGPAQPDAPYGRETRRALDFFLDQGKKLGFRTANIDNRAGYVEWGSGDRLIAVLCHLDVVPAGDGWTTDPFDPVIQPDRIVARGTSDDKGPAISTLYAMKDLMESSFRSSARIRLIVGLDEEKGSSCMSHYRKLEELPDAGFTPDASFPVIYAEKGICWITFTLDGGQPSEDSLRLVEAAGGESPNMIPGRCTLTFQADQQEPYHKTILGQPGHASKPWMGTNAISKAMATASQHLSDAGCHHPFVDFYQTVISDEWNGSGLGISGSDDSGPLTCNIGKLSLDSQQGSITADLRYPVSWSLNQLVESIDERVRPYGVKPEIIQHLAPLYRPRQSKLVSALSSVYSRLTETDAEPIAIGGGTYARTMPNLVAFGGTFPGDPDMAHQAGEYITLENLLATATIYREALIALANG